MKDKKLEALIRKVAGATKTPKGNKTRFVDPTLQATAKPEAEDDSENRQLFKEMKRREF
ncbi:MAG TPA: hypothetical protein VHW65_11905 [Gemmatimonadales bacterium]|jgi:hypothetical protein|nr:hypothetical protein [Gemmatimonadales bacterium]